MKTKKKLLEIARGVVRADRAINTAIYVLEDCKFDFNELDDDDTETLAQLLKPHRESQGGFSDSELYGSYFQEHAQFMRKLERILDAR